MTDILVSADELALELGKGGRAAPVLLDVRWTMGTVDRAAYRNGHLPGAVFVDLDADLAAPPGLGGRHPLPQSDVLQLLWRRLGIDDGGRVVVYDSKDGSVAARAWWLLRWSGLTGVRVLDGGFAAWVSDADRAVETGEPAPPPSGNMTVVPGGMPAVSDDDAAALAGAGDLLDARAAARYRGETEPLDPIAGHIPGAINLPFTELLTPDGRFLSRTELRSSFDRVGAGTGTAASCGSGITACHLVLAAEIAGLPMALYPGSYSGWLALGRPVATGPDPAGSVPQIPAVTPLS